MRAADRLRSATEPLSHVLERGPARCQRHQALASSGCSSDARSRSVRAAAPALPRWPWCDAAAGGRSRRTARRWCSRRESAASSHSAQRRRGSGWCRPRCCACRRSASGERPRRRASAMRSPADAQVKADRLVLMRQVRVALPVRCPGACCAVREPARPSDRDARPSAAAGRPATVPALSSASSARDHAPRAPREDPEGSGDERRPRRAFARAGARYASTGAGQRRAGEAACPRPCSSAEPALTSSRTLGSAEAATPSQAAWLR